jgi:hypothetical protein
MNAARIWQTFVDGVNAIWTLFVFVAQLTIDTFKRIYDVFRDVLRISPVARTAFEGLILLLIAYAVLAFLDILGLIH